MSLFQNHQRYVADGGNITSLIAAITGRRPLSAT